MLRSKRAGGLVLVRFALFFLVGLVTFVGKTNGKKWRINMSFHTRQKTCWIFTHMNKSGGSTVKSLLFRFIDRANVSHGLLSGTTYRHGEDAMKHFIGENYTVVAGGYAEGFRAAGGGGEGCKWFTVFRHPIARLVSAYYYCMGGDDQLCASSIMRAEDVDLHTFAEHWGNFGLRQLALAFLPQDEILAVSTAQCGRTCPSWYKARIYLQEVYEAHGGGSPGDPGASEAEPSLAPFLEPVKELVQSNYTAVGILEDWNNSMSLFDHALDLPDFKWTDESSQVGAKKRNTQSEKADTLSEAWDDPVLKHFLRLDILLYEHAVAVHNEQLSAYGLL